MLMRSHFTKRGLPSDQSFWPYVARPTLGLNTLLEGSTEVFQAWWRVLWWFTICLLIWTYLDIKGLNFLNSLKVLVIMIAKISKALYFTITFTIVAENQYGNSSWSPNNCSVGNLPLGVWDCVSFSLSQPDAIHVLGVLYIIWYCLACDMYYMSSLYCWCCKSYISQSYT